MRLTNDDFHEPRVRRTAARPSRFSRRLSRIAAAGLVVGFSGLVAAQMLGGPPQISIAVDNSGDAASAKSLVALTSPVVVALRHAELLDPHYSLGAVPVSFGKTVGLRPQFVARAQGVATPEPVAAPEMVATLEADDRAEVADAPELPLPAPRPADLAILDTLENLPAPPPRPAELARTPDAPRARAFSPRLARLDKNSPQQTSAAPAEGGSFFEKLFGRHDPAGPGPALAYASPQDSAVRDYAPSSGAKPSGYDKYTAVYDISARTVHLPDGTRLEAHSGLGEMLDNPNYAHVRMRGVTPPALYDLKEREALFHGVRAIRLTPLNSSVHGRSGLLAHTYMLGPNGQSNGCVSFRDYQAFLRAYLNGDVKKLAVVARM